MPPPSPNRFFQFFSEMGRAFLQTKFLPVDSSLGHLSIKIFQIGPTVLALKLDKGKVLEGSNPTIEQKFTYFYNHEDDIPSKQILA